MAGGLSRLGAEWTWDADVLSYLAVVEALALLFLLLSPVPFWVCVQLVKRAQDLVFLHVQLALRLSVEQIQAGKV